MKKIILLLSATVVLVACSKVGKGEYIISGTAKGIENGKTVILETQDETGVVAKDTVKVENGKFEMKGKITEPAFYTIKLEGAQAPIPFILENGEEVTIEINKDSIQKSKVSGTYNNDEYVKFTEELNKIQNKLVDFQTKNTPAMQAAQQAKDTATINKLMQEFGKIQQEVGIASKAKYLTYAETHPKSFISVLILQGVLNDPSTDIKKAEAMFNKLEESLQNTKPGKAVKEALGKLKGGPAAVAPSVGGAK
ncbi:DUF4369 domain-containing protein [Flavobacterium sp.]|uniref:DUF4369 domain-containing protein n=1 Tax=Flavobacterium sp. TaxID=239 RepID=UPI00286EF570|nr:DUF4369 domain-containing protein [Flavobacterium sp.]